MPSKQKNAPRRFRRAKDHDLDDVQTAANSYCIRHFAIGFSGGTPRRLFLKGVNVWIVPVLFTSPGYGVVGEVGIVAIDARNFEVIGATSREEVKAAAARLAQENRDALAAAFLKQQSPDACALACLRMILAYQGVETTEAELVQAAAMEPGGLDPEEIAQLAKHYGLRAVEEQLPADRLFTLIKGERFPIVVVYRRPIDAVEAGHAVIPIRLSRRHVILLDPLYGERRVTIRKFEEARRLAGQWVVVWEPST